MLAVIVLSLLFVLISRAQVNLTLEQSFFYLSQNGDSDTGCQAKDLVLINAILTAEPNCRDSKGCFKPENRSSRSSRILCSRNLFTPSSDPTQVKQPPFLYASVYGESDSCASELARVTRVFPADSRCYPNPILAGLSAPVSASPDDDWKVMGAYFTARCSPNQPMKLESCQDSDCKRCTPVNLQNQTSDELSKSGDCLKIGPNASKKFWCSNALESGRSEGGGDKNTSGAPPVNPARTNEAHTVNDGLMNSLKFVMHTLLFIVMLLVILFGF